MCIREQQSASENVSLEALLEIGPKHIGVPMNMPMGMPICLPMGMPMGMSMGMSMGMPMVMHRKSPCTCLWLRTGPNL